MFRNKGHVTGADGDMTALQQKAKVYGAQYTTNVKTKQQQQQKKREHCIKTQRKVKH